MIRRQIMVDGVVQGVGFRPYVYRLAVQQDLTGNIANTPVGVIIEVEGSLEAVEKFVEQLPVSIPPLAKITSLIVRELSCVGGQGFQIVTSQRGEPARTLIPADVATCSDCLRELFDPSDRRFHYPFLNCTNCGPRFTIIRDIPYDRAHTSMAKFLMCAQCQAEYDDPLDRRFHAQPNACWKCGPQLQLCDKQGNDLHSLDPIADTAAALKAGLVVAIKGLGGFHLAVDATNSAAVTVLRERKHRVEKPFAIMLPDVKAAESLCEIDENARYLLQLPQRPIVLLRRKQSASVCEAIAPNIHELGIFLPYTPLHHLLLAEGGFDALVMTSGNLSEEPIAIDNAEAVLRLSGLTDLLLLHNREILLRCDDSVVRSLGNMGQQIRRSRGFVPVPIFLRKEVPSVLAVGGELKNTICLTRGKHAFLSQHIGDLENVESYQFFEEAIEYLGRVLEISPTIVGYDLHPDYFSTRWTVEECKLPRLAIQHHHAHVASCMAENQLPGQDYVIGIALDGTGYGTDGEIWGGEVLIANYKRFLRAAHLEYVVLPGGAETIREPWRMAVSYLYYHFGREFLNMHLPFVESLDARKLELLLRMIEKHIHCRWTSSCGRLFDAVAALIGLRNRVSYEAQAAIELEAIADACEQGAYPFQIKIDSGITAKWVIGTAPLFEAIIRDLQQGVHRSIISARFHNGLAKVLTEVARLVREQNVIERACITGGTLNNVYLRSTLGDRLKDAGFEVFIHREVPAGDGGLSLGQAMIVAHAFENSNGTVCSRS